MNALGGGQFARAAVPGPGRGRIRRTARTVFVRLRSAAGALCKTYNADIQSGDTYDISQALQQAFGTLSPELERDMQAVVTGTTLNQDLNAQVEVTFDRALVK